MHHFPLLMLTGCNAELPSRKRTLSNSDNDSVNSFKSKKLNGLLRNNDTKETCNSVYETHQDSGHKRPAEVAVDVDSKKLCVSVEQTEELERLRKLQKAASLQGVPISDPPQEPECFVDLAIESVVAKASASALTQPKDLPFLRKLHKKELSKMSRSVSRNFQMFFLFFNKLIKLLNLYYLFYFQF